LAEIKMPIFVLWGDKDRVIHPSAADVVEKKAPNVTKVIMKKCGHTPMIERPKEAASHYLAFISKLELGIKAR